MPAELSYDRFEGDRGPKLIVLHGLFGSRRNWRSVARALSGFEDTAGRRPTIYTVDLRHHGESPKTGPFNLDDLAEDVCDFIKGLAGETGDGSQSGSSIRGQSNSRGTSEGGGGPVTIMGHSLGGKVAVLALQKCPQLIERLILVDITPFRVPEGVCNELRSVVGALQELMRSEFTNRQEAEIVLGKYITAPEAVQFLLHNLRRGTDGNLHMQLGVEAIAKNFDQACRPVLPEEFPNQSPGLEEGWREIPLVMITGEKSNYMPEAHHRMLSAWFQMNLHHTIENAGHWLQVEKKEEFVRAVASILQG